MAMAAGEATPLFGSKKDIEKAIPPPIPGIHHHAAGRIGRFGTLALFVNELVGPGMVNLPWLYQRAGFIPTTGALILVGALSAICAINLSDLIRKVPNNQNFGVEVEYSALFRAYLGWFGYVASQLIFTTSVMCLTIASIVDTAQVVDSILGSTRHTVAYRVSPSFGWDWWRIDTSTTSCAENSLACVPFSADQQSLLITAGYALSMLVLIPISLQELKENIPWQIFVLVVTVLSLAQFMWSFLSTGVNFDNVSLFGYDHDDLFGVILFNFALGVAIPSWLYEKEPSVYPKSAITESVIYTTFMYIIFGYVGAIAVDNAPHNLLAVLTSGNEWGHVTRWVALFFTLVVMGLGVPLFSILVRLNLIGSGFSLKSSLLIAVVFPWLVSWMLYHGEVVEYLENYGGLIMCIVVFVGPLALCFYEVIVIPEDLYKPLSGSFSRIQSKEKIEVGLLLLATLGILVWVVSFPSGPDDPE